MTFEKIMERMLERVPEDVDRREGSVIWDALAPSAAELALLYQELLDVREEAFADTASREYLIRRAGERGLAPYPASRAVLRGEFSPEDAEVMGQRFSLDALNYVVTERIAGGAYRLECETEGAAGNRNFGRMIPVEYIPGLESARLVSLLIPGEEEEDTERFRRRYYDSFDVKAYGGNVRDYEEKVGAIAGVGAVKVIPVRFGPGTVGLTVIDSEYRQATPELIDRVQEIMDPRRDQSGVGVAPIDHIVTVDTVREVALGLSFRLAFDEGASWDSVGGQAIAALEEYFEALRRQWQGEKALTLRISQIETRLLALDGVLDVGETRIGGREENRALAWDEIPVLGEVEAE